METIERAYLPMIGRSQADLPFHYNKGEGITVVFRTDRAMLEALLPPVLTLPEGPGTAVVRVVSPRNSTFGPYIGVYLGALALFEGKPALHGLTGIKTDFAGVIAGREIWGMPLQVGDARMEWVGDVLTVTAGRHGIDFMRLAVRIGRRTTPPPSLGMLTYSTRTRPSDPNSNHGLLTARGEVVDPSEVEHWTATSVLKFPGGEPGDDWSALPVHEVVETRYNQGGRSILDRGPLLAEWPPPLPAES